MASDLRCVTQEDVWHPAVQPYITICTKNADLMATSTHCPPECGGHPICRPCFDLAETFGILKEAQHG